MTITNDTQNGRIEKIQGYARLNGLSMYHEVQGTGKPLVYIPMGFGVTGTTEFPKLTRNRKLITFDLQGRGRTADIDRPLSFEQQAEDVVALLKHLDRAGRLPGRVRWGRCGDDHRDPASGSG